MKKIIESLLVIVTIATIASCTTHVKTGDGSSEVTKNGKITTETRKVEQFNKIEVDGVFNVILNQGQDVGLKIETDGGIAEHILSEVNNGVLTLKMEDDTDFGDIDPIKIYIQVNDLQSLTTRGVGAVSCPDMLKLDKFNLDCEGVGAVELKISANKLIVNSKTVGLITLAGKVTEADITHNGVGMLQAFDLLTQQLKLSSEGVGAAEVYASESIEINASGIGSVNYKGNPKNKNINSDGIGKVSAAD